ncbi:unnamed protein product [Urochloa humidicola]
MQRGRTWLGRNGIASRVTGNATVTEAFRGGWGGGGHDEAGAPRAAVERLDRVVEEESRRGFQRRGPRAELAESGEPPAAALRQVGVGHLAPIRRVVFLGAAGVAGGHEADHGGLEPAAVEVVGDVDLDLGAGGKRAPREAGRRRRSAAGGDHWGYKSHCECCCRASAMVLVQNKASVL